MAAVGFVAALRLCPAMAQAPQIDPQAAAGRLLDALRRAPDEQEAALVEAHVEELWAQEGSPAVRLLMARGTRELKAGDDGDAREDFDAALALDDTLASAWYARAEARAAAGDTTGAVADLAQAVKREPRDFLAYRMLADIAAQRQDWKSALAAWQKLLDIDPMTPGGAHRLKELTVKALGQET
ncbi:MAG TPA: tetratricopeptide repeat protein [Acetobacteraceae bacterium]|nr:tetratricopeptide repeat protein [Acetobacteraceae bacterium]